MKFPVCVFLKIHNDICFFLVGMEVSESTAEECKHSFVFSAALLRFAAEIRGVMNLWAQENKIGSIQRKKNTSFLFLNNTLPSLH